MVAAGKKLKVFLIMIIALVVVLGGSVLVLVKYANKIMKSELERRLGKSFSIERIDLKWGHVEVAGIVLKNVAGKEVIRVGNLSVTADFMGLLRKEYVISSLAVKDPYLFVEVDNKGQIVNPVLPPELKADQSKTPEQPAPPITVKTIEVVNGSIDYLDRKTPVTPVLTRMRNVELTVKDVSVPFGDGFSSYTLSAGIPGNMSTGTLKSSGRIKAKTKDMDIKTNLKTLDITGLKPYFQKQSAVNITKGFLDLDLSVKVASEKLHAPGTAILRGLEFQSGSGMGGEFLGVPLSFVVAFLKSSNNEISMNFVLEGDLNNPRFDLKENLMDRVSIAFAEKLGLPLKRIPEAITGVGATGAGEVESTVKGLGKSFKDLLKNK